MEGPYNHSVARIVHLRAQVTTLGAEYERKNVELHARYPSMPRNCPPYKLRRLNRIRRAMRVAKEQITNIIAVHNLSADIMGLLGILPHMQHEQHSFLTPSPSNPSSPVSLTTLFEFEQHGQRKNNIAGQDFDRINRHH
jgi:hypothetical protein